MKGEFGEDEAGRVAPNAGGARGQRNNAGAIGEAHMGKVPFHFAAEGFSPIFHLLQAFNGLALGAGNDQPLAAGMQQAIDHGFSRAGKVFAGLPSPQPDFEPAVVTHPGLLVGMKPLGEHSIDPFGNGTVV